MPPPLDQARRATLLAGVIDYIAENGLGDLSLRPLAASMGTTARMLIHYFGTKEQMLVAALETQRPDVTRLFADVDDVATLRSRVMEACDANATGESARSTRVVLQVLAAASVGRGPFLAYAHDAVHVLVDELTETLARIDPLIEDPESAATILVSGIRGLVLDRQVTGDHDRFERSTRRLVDQTLRRLERGA